MIIVEVIMDNVDSLLSQALSETNNLNEGEIFLVKDLFKGYEWNRIERKNRLLLGTLFLGCVVTSKISGIEVVDKTSSNQRRYKKQQKK